MQTFGVHSPSKCWLSHIYFCSILIFHGVYTITLQAGCKFLLSKQMFALHSPSRCWLFSIFLILMQFRIFYTNTLQAGLRFMLSMQMFGLHSPSRCWLYQIHPCFIEYHTLTLHARFRFQSPCRCLVILSLSKQVVGSQS